MSKKPRQDLVLRILKSVARCFDRATVQKLADLRLDKRSQALLKKLAEKSTEGTLTAAEHEEYLSAVKVMNTITILQIEARQQPRKKRRARVS